MIKRNTIETNRVNTISWLGNSLIDWGAAGRQYFLDGQVRELYKYHFTGGFDSSIISKDGKHCFIYQRLGTKGLLFREGDLIREINRSYYCANVYEYPAAFITVYDVTYLIHCPQAYNRLDFENVETGEIITDSLGREPSDFFHSRLEISPNGAVLLSKGWFWHPLDMVKAYNIHDCMNDPKMLDETDLWPDVGIEICSASFINDTKVLVYASDEEIDDENKNLPPKHLAVWDLVTNDIINPVKAVREFGNVFAINEYLAWDMFKFPKVINIYTGEIVDSLDTVNSGEQSSPIIHHLDYVPQIVFNRETKQIAIGIGKTIEVLTYEM